MQVRDRPPVDGTVERDQRHRPSVAYPYVRRERGVAVDPGLWLGPRGVTHLPPRCSHTGALAVPRYPHLHTAAGSVVLLVSDRTGGWSDGWPHSGGSSARCHTVPSSTSGGCRSSTGRGRATDSLRTA